MKTLNIKHFSKLQEARPQFPGMYRGDDFIKKHINNSGNSGIMNLGNSQLKPFTKVKVEDIPPMDEQKFNTKKAILKKSIKENRDMYYMKLKEVSTNV